MPILYLFCVYAYLLHKYVCICSSVYIIRMYLCLFLTYVYLETFRHECMQSKTVSQLENVTFFL